MNWELIYALSFISSLLLSLIFTAICRKLAFKWGFLDRPLGEKHKQHENPTPVMGGIAMYLSWLITIIGGIIFSSLLSNLLSSDVLAFVPGIKHVWNQLLIIILGGTSLIIIGMYDDISPIGPLPKLVAQFWIAGATACWGIRITMFWGPPLFTWFITTFWIIMIINAINFFDNMDGLTAGFTTIASFLFLSVSFINHQYFVSVISAITMGTAMGFWIHNRYPAKIYMGDAGSHFLGYMLAVIGVLTTFHSSQTPTPFAVLIPLIILSVPILDLLLVAYIRTSIGKPIYVGDHNHISHRFLALGMTKLNAVRCVHLISLLLGLGAIPLMWLGFKGVIVVMLQIIVTLIFMFILANLHLRKIISSNKKTLEAT